MALIKKQLLAKEDMLLSADNTPVSQARAGTTVSVHPVNASVIPFDGTRSIVEAVEDLAYTHPLTHPVSIIDGSSNPSKFVKTDTLGNTGFDNVTWAEIEGKPGTYTPSAHEHSMVEVTAGTLSATRIDITADRQFITADQLIILANAESLSNKGQPLGYAPLDNNGKINSSFLSDLNLVEVFTPADLASMLALTSAQPGDIAYRQDNSTSYMLVALPASTEANWKSLNTGSQVISVNGQTGVVSLNTSNIAESTNLYFTNERVDDRVANLLQAGTNITLAYNDALNTLTISANDTSVDWSEVQSKPTTISGYGITDAYTKTETDSALSLKAPLASPALTGTPTAPTAPAGTNTQQIATTAFVANLDSANVKLTGNQTIDGVKTFSSTIAGSINGNAGTVTNGVYTTGNQTINGVKTFSSSPIVPTPTVGNQAVNRDYVDNKYSGFKNYIINGGFDIDQYQRGAQSNWNSYNCYIDRFLVLDSSSVVHNGAEANNPRDTGLHNHLSVTKTAGADTKIVQRWEIPKDKAKQFLNGRTLTFSCWVLAGTSNFIEQLYFIKVGTSANSYEVKEFNITKNNVADIWTRVTGTITNIQWTYEAGEYIEIRLDPVNGLAGELHTTGWQLEEGSVATPFENRPYGLELSLCQRYYERLRNDGAILAVGAGGFNSVNTIRAYGKVNTKRVNPSVVVVGYYRIMGTSYQGNAISSLIITALSNGAYFVDAATTESFQANLPVCIESLNPNNDSYMEFLAEL